MNKTLLIAMLTAIACAVCATSQADGKTPAVNGDAIDGIVNAVMKDAYGDNFDAKRKCWAYTEKDDSGDVAYCMLPGTSKVIDTSSGKQLYLSAYSFSGPSDDQKYIYDHTQSGLGGFFQIKLDDKGGWSYVAAKKDFEAGTTGSCGCESASLVKVNNNGDYGFLFSSGGEWQGVIVSNYSIVVAINGVFQDISSLSRITEKNQSAEYDLKFNQSATTDKFYPVKVTEKNIKTGVVISNHLVRYDVKKQTYEMPGK